MSVYQKLVAAYPLESRSDLYTALAGEWPTLIDHPNYQNTCAIRMSVMFNAAGYPIPKSYREGIAGDGRNIMIKVKNNWDFVKATFGDFSFGMTKLEGTEVTIPARTGIICYHKAFEDASGHFDLWHGTGFVGTGKMSDVIDGYDVALWYLD